MALLQRKHAHSLLNVPTCTLEHVSKRAYLLDTHLEQNVLYQRKVQEGSGTQPVSYFSQTNKGAIGTMKLRETRVHKTSRHLSVQKGKMVLVSLRLRVALLIIFRSLGFPEPSPSISYPNPPTPPKKEMKDHMTAPSVEHRVIKFNPDSSGRKSFTCSPLFTIVHLSLDFRTVSLPTATCSTWISRAAVFAEPQGNLGVLTSSCASA